jgi:uncharacterized RmlC-like cupin family protein
MHATVHVVHPADADTAPGPPTPGMDRRQLIDEGDRWIGWVKTTPGMSGGWHYHGDRDTYIFMTTGALTVDFGPGGRESVTMSAGDFGFVPPRTVHRETTAAAEGAEAFVVRIGSGPQNVNVDGPDPG